MLKFEPYDLTTMDLPTDLQLGGLDSPGFFEDDSSPEQAQQAPSACEVSPSHTEDDEQPFSDETTPVCCLDAYEAPQQQSQQQQLQLLQQQQQQPQMIAVPSPSGGVQYVPYALLANLQAQQLVGQPRILVAAGGEQPKPFTCRHEGCAARFASDRSRKRHEKAHAGDRPFQCPYANCPRRFARRSDLTVHERVHTGERPYACEAPGCGKRFTRSSDLRIHERIHGEERPYACGVAGCGATFKRRSDLRKHDRVHAPHPAGQPQFCIEAVSALPQWLIKTEAPELQQVIQLPAAPVPVVPVTQLFDPFVFP